MDPEHLAILVGLRDAVANLADAVSRFPKGANQNELLSPVYTALERVSERLSKIND